MHGAGPALFAARRLGRRPAGVGEQRLGDRDDLRCRSVVVLEVHDARAGEHAREAREPGGIGTGEREDRLVRVADDAEVGALRQPGAHEPELRGADVLELVDEQVPEAELLLRGELLVVLERVRAPPQEVVEVDEPGPPLVALVAGVRVGDELDATHRCAPCQLRGGGVHVGPEQPGLRPLDLAREVGGDRERLGPAPLDDPQQEADLPLEQRGHRPVAPGGAAPQLGERDGVQGARGDAGTGSWRGGVRAGRDGERLEAPRELPGRMAGEGERQHVRRLGRTRGDPPRDPARQHTGLARSGPGHDRERSVLATAPPRAGSRRAQPAAAPSADRTDGV